MRRGTSLNPYAESYVPLSKRETTGIEKQLTSRGHEFPSVNEGVTRGSHLWESSVQAPQGNNIYSVDTTSYIADNTKMIDFHGYHGSSSYNPGEMTDKAHFDEDFEMHVAYLQTTFPSVSYESLADVFVANNCDVDATIDVLNHLELYHGDSSAKLPDTLDIGDVPESGFSSEAPVLNSKNFNIEAGGSSSDVSRPDPTNVKLG